MAQLQALRRRVRSISNTRQTTKAMQLVDATKLRRAQEASKRSKDYIEAALATLQRLLARDVDQSDLARWHRAKVETIVLVAIASDRGLAGAYNHAIAARLRTETTRFQAEGMKVKVVAIGTHAIHATKYLHDVEVIERITGRPTDPGMADVRPLASRLRQLYVDGRADAIKVIYTHSISSLQQEVRLLDVWPIDLATAAATAPKSAVVTLLEPSPEAVIDAALARLFDASILNAAQEAGVSEHAMRMLAMRNATDNASDLIDSLSLQINTIRQAGITQEISEITGAAAAIEEQ